MLFRILGNTSMTFAQKLLYALVLVFCVLLSLSVHELCHGLAALAMGDKTAKFSGRLSLNPMQHLDPIGAICLFLFGFGWARPVPVNPRNFRKPKLGMVLTALAGPVSNLILAFLAMIGCVVFQAGNGVSEICRIICYYLLTLNVGLAIFNLIPIPPLDGSKVLMAILPTNLYFKYMQFERYGFILLIVLINLPFFNQILNGAVSGIIGLYSNIISLFIS